MAKVTAKQIAAKLGLSPSAVSLALNGKTGVSENTRQQVLEAALQMGYSKPNSAGIQINNRTICFVRYAGPFLKVAESTSFSTFVLQGVEARATELGYGIQVRYLNSNDLYNPQMLDALRQADGVIFLGTDLTEQMLPEIERLLAYLDSCPVVVVDSVMLSDRVDSVTNDGIGGARMATEHLIKTGHQRIGYVRAKQRVRNLEERELGVKQALAAAGRHLEAVINVDISSEKAFQDFDSWIRTQESMPDGLFADNDILAAAAIRALKKNGYRVPQDVSVIGFDDIPTCEMLDPPLTTIHAFKEELGGVAVEHLHRRIQRGEIPHQISNIGLLSTTLSTRLVTRFSVRNR